ncbi:MAG: carboxypeptidase-like regulatory domain-containing protein [Acidobacteria bacterium]|nr:carboxypeptidase-like regulatory domain-containing protein [Acidobacteriota bacterium]
MFRLLLALTFSLPLLAQSTSLSGVIRDNQNGVISGAVISLTNVDTSTPRKTLSTPTGDYVFNQIPPGNYTLEAQMPGFRTSSQQLRLQVNVPLSVNIQLEVGQVTETINVMGESTVVNTQNATLGNAFTEVPVTSSNSSASNPASPPPAKSSVPGAIRTTSPSTASTSTTINPPEPPTPTAASSPPSPSPSIPFRSSASPSPARAPTRAAPPAVKSR